MVPSFSRYEGQDTYSDIQRSNFDKLSIAYVLTSSVVPLASFSLVSGGWASSSRVVSQGWYENGGVLLSAVTMMTLEPLVELTLRAFQPFVSFNQKSERQRSQRLVVADM